MARLLTADPNILKLHDNISNSEVVFYYRTPTAKEMSSYTNGMTKRIRSKIINRVGENRQAHGLDILTGFREGDFLVPKNGQNVAISSDPTSPNYDPEWRSVLKKYAADLIAAVAMHVFEDTSDRDDSSLDDDAESGSDNGATEDPNS